MLSKTDITAHFDRVDSRPSRALGQNFVADPNTVRKIVRIAEVTANSKVLEIGAGLGSLTLALAETGAQIIAVEIDRHLIGQLTENVRTHSNGNSSNVRIVHADAMALDWNEVAPADEGPYTLVANLPYNVATPLVCDLLDFVPQIESMLIMVQKEVGERLSARVGDVAYGAVSVKVSYYAEASLAGVVPPSVFVPQPNVDSALVRIVRRAEPLVSEDVVPAEQLFAVVKLGFAQRRKMLRGTLGKVIGLEPFDRAGIDPTSRAESLDVAQWCRLAGAARPMQEWT